MDIAEQLTVSATREGYLCIGCLDIFISLPKNYLSYSPFSIALIIPFLFSVMLLMGNSLLPKTICNNNASLRTCVTVKWEAPCWAQLSTPLILGTPQLASFPDVGATQRASESPAVFRTQRPSLVERQGLGLCGFTKYPRRERCPNVIYCHCHLEQHKPGLVSPPFGSPTRILK